MNTGTKSVLFGVHQFLIHPFFVARAWWIVYREWPKLHEWCAILTHDIGYWGCPNMDGPEGELHPERVANWWRRNFEGEFGERVWREVIGHSRFHAAKHGLPLSKLFRPDKLATALYPRWLYLILGMASGEIREYMAIRNTKYAKSVHGQLTMTRTQWLIEAQANCALYGILGEQHPVVKEQMERSKNVVQD